MTGEINAMPLPDGQIVRITWAGDGSPDAKEYKVLGTNDGLVALQATGEDVYFWVAVGHIREMRPVKEQGS